MNTTPLSVSEFKTHCTTILRELDTKPRRIEVTNRGRVIAVVAPPAAVQPADPSSRLGSLRGSVLHYEAPFAPAADASDWAAHRS